MITTKNQLKRVIHSITNNGQGSHCCLNTTNKYYTLPNVCPSTIAVVNILSAASSSSPDSPDQTGNVSLQAQVFAVGRRPTAELLWSKSIAGLSNKSGTICPWRFNIKYLTWGGIHEHCIELTVLLSWPNSHSHLIIKPGTFGHC